MLKGGGGWKKFHITTEFKNIEFISTSFSLFLNQISFYINTKRSINSIVQEPLDISEYSHTSTFRQSRSGGAFSGMVVGQGDISQPRLQ